MAIQMIGIDHTKAVNRYPYNIFIYEEKKRGGA